MLVARGRAKRGNEAVADAHLGKGPEGRGLCAVVLANGPDEPEHPLLDQVLAVAARQKERARARAHKTGIAPDKRFLRLAAAVGAIYSYLDAKKAPASLNRYYILKDLEKYIKESQ